MAPVDRLTREGGGGWGSPGHSVHGLLKFPSQATVFVQASNQPRLLRPHVSTSLAQTLRVALHPYQRQGLWWMARREALAHAGEAGWLKYSFPDERERERFSFNFAFKEET